MRLSRSEIAAAAYVAAILDGEGYIGAIRRQPRASNRMKSPKYELRVAVTMADRKTILFVANFCGLGHKAYVRPRRQPHHSDMWVLDLENHRAIDLLRRVLPFMIAKKSQAELAIELWNLRLTSRANITQSSGDLKFKAGPQAGKPYRALKLNDGFLKKCDDLYLAMRRREVTNNGIVSAPQSARN